MRNILQRLWKDERGFVVSAEMVLIVTIGVLGMIVGISSIASSINNEMNDISNAFGALDQSYWYSGLTKVGHSGVVGSGYADSQDFCDCSTIVRTVPRVKFPGPVPPRVVPPHVIPPRVVPPGPWGDRFGGRHGWWSEAGVWQGAFGFGHAGVGFGHGAVGIVIRHADGSVVPLGGGATAILIDGTVVHVHGLCAIRLADGTFMPLSAGCAIQLADGRLVALPGIAAFRLNNGMLIRVRVGSLLALPNGMMLPLAIADGGRFAVGQAIALTGAVGLRFVDGLPVAFAERTVVQIVKSSVSLLHVPAAISLSTDGIVWMLTGAATTLPHVPFAGAMHAAIAGDVVSLVTANVILPRGGKRAVVTDAAMIRLVNGSLIPLSQAHYLRIATGAIVPLNLAVLVRLYDGSYVALAGGFAVQLQNGTLVPLASAGELRLKSGIAVPLFGCIGPQPGCLQLCPAPIINRNGPAPKLHQHPRMKKVMKFRKKFHPGKKGPDFKGKPKFRKPVPSKNTDE